jgi:hypothetical protein
MKYIDLKGIFLGGFFSLLGVVVIVIVSSLFKVSMFGRSEYEDVYTNPERAIITINCIISYLWSGFIISKISKKGKLVNPLIVSTITMILAFFPGIKLPILYVFTSGVIAPPLFYLGAKLHLLKAANFKITSGSISENLSVFQVFTLFILAIIDLSVNWRTVAFYPGSTLENMGILFLVSFIFSAVINSIILIWKSPGNLKTHWKGFCIGLIFSTVVGLFAGMTPVNV